MRIRVLAGCFGMGVTALLLTGTAAQAAPQSGAHVSAAVSLSDNAGGGGGNGNGGGGGGNGNWSPTPTWSPTHKCKPKPKPTPTHKCKPKPTRPTATPTPKPTPTPTQTPAVTVVTNTVGRRVRPDGRRQHGRRRQHRWGRRSAGRGRRRGRAVVGRSGSVRLPPLAQDGRLGTVVPASPPTQATGPVGPRYRPRRRCAVRGRCRRGCVRAVRHACRCRGDLHPGIGDDRPAAADPRPAR